MAACAWCKKPGTKRGFKCPRCNNAWFDVCNQECQKAFWDQHKKTYKHIHWPENAKMIRRQHEEYYDYLLKCMSDDLFPSEVREGVYGIRKDRGPMVTVTDAFGNIPPWLPAHMHQMQLGNVVFNAWVTLRNTGQLEKEPFVEALSSSRLPQWFEQQIRSSRRPDDGGPSSGYVKALVEGDLFKHIEWNESMLDLAHKASLGL